MSFDSDITALIPNLRAFAMSLCNDLDRADDLVQETMLKALAARDSFAAGTNLKAWLFTILRNTYFTEQRRRHREVPDADGMHAAQLAAPDDQEQSVHLKDVARAYGALPFISREALYLVSMSGYKYTEAAEMIGCAVGTVKSRLCRGRRQMVAALEPRRRRR